MAKESREFEALQRRIKKNGKPEYSLGHRRMYEIPLRGELFGKQHRILEAGFGIGWGLDLMRELGVIQTYIGFEPNMDSYNYVTNRLKGDHRLALVNRPFSLEYFQTDPLPEYDAAFCIEVIEHVPMELHLEFLRSLRRLTPRLFFSTPDIRKAPKEGVRTTPEWVALLKQAGFGSVDTVTSEWTHLYKCA